MVETMNAALLGCQPSGIRRFTALAKSRTGLPVSYHRRARFFSTPEPIKEATKTALDQNLTHYPPGAGELYLRERISRFEQEQNGVSYSPEEILVVDGATEGLYLALRGILNPGDEVIVPTPAFGLYEPLVALSSGVYVPMDTCADHFQITRKIWRSISPQKAKQSSSIRPTILPARSIPPSRWTRSIRWRRRKISLSFVTTCTHSWSIVLSKFFPGIRTSGKKSSSSRVFPSHTP